MGIEEQLDLTKQYYVFAFHDYYPCGGLTDIEFTTNSLEEAIGFIKGSQSTATNFQLFDRTNGREIDHAAVRPSE